MAHTYRFRGPLDLDHMERLCEAATLRPWNYTEEWICAQVGDDEWACTYSVPGQDVCLCAMENILGLPRTDSDDQSAGDAPDASRSPSP